MKTITFDERAWKLVPVEPTNAALDHAIRSVFGVAAGEDTSNWKHYMYLLWGSMLAASPANPDQLDIDPPASRSRILKAAQHWSEQVQKSPAQGATAWVKLVHCVSAELGIGAAPAKRDDHA